ncbi:MAG: hypothetical protein IT581_16045 [Verrucomicrobiales bacterium]|nr:hypothetical protein [Verrucomicrobiales bacterium]
MKIVVSMACILFTALVIGTGCASSGKSGHAEQRSSDRHWAATETQVANDAGWTLRPVSDQP